MATNGDRGAPAPIRSTLQAVALLGNHVPRQCGIATFTTDLGAAIGWFLGQNDLHQPLYDASTGGCRDGLHADRVNENQGAESTISFLMALRDMRSGNR